MQYLVEYRVVPVEVEGEGIPFGKRRMWAIEDWGRMEGAPYADRFPVPDPLQKRPAYWSRSVAERIAAECVKWHRSVVEQHLGRMQGLTYGQ